MTRRDFFDRYLRAYDALNLLDDYRAYQEDIARRLCEGKGKLILDAGSGTGTLSIAMRRLGARVISLDFSSSALEIHRKKDPFAEQVQATLESPLSFPDGIFDGLACASVLFALSDAGRKLALREFRRVLRPGRHMVVTASMTNMSIGRAALNHCRGRVRSQPAVAFANEMVRTCAPLLRLLYYTYRIRSLRRQQGYRRFTREELEAAIREAGFTRLRYETTFVRNYHLLTAFAPRSGKPGPKGEKGKGTLIGVARPAARHATRAGQIAPS